MAELASSKLLIASQFPPPPAAARSPYGSTIPRRPFDDHRSHLGGVALLLFGKTYLWLTPMFASPGVSANGVRWAITRPRSPCYVCLAGDMEDSVDVAPVKSRDKSAGVRSRDGDELHAATISLPA